MLFAFAFLDHVVIAGYLTGTILVGVLLSRRQKNAEEYLLAGRSMPWLAVGLSLLATLTSSLTYLSSPGEVWKSGVNYVLGKILAVPLEAVVAFFFLIPFLMRFRFTSAYEYLGHRFGLPARRLGEGLFACLVISWMGFVVLATSRALRDVTDLPLPLVIATVGIGATLYTVLGGFRAVIWTEVAQVGLMIGGAVTCIFYVALSTGTGPLQWHAASVALLSEPGRQPVPFFSADPLVRTSVVTFMINMAAWYLLTHAGNQMAVQRYFATTDLKKALKSFLTAAGTGMVLNLLLATTGLALLFAWTRDPSWLPADFNPAGGGERGPDIVFPRFMKEKLPPGLAGAVLAAVLSCAMSTIDSGVNALATVLTVARDGRVDRQGGHAVGHARALTLIAGICITGAAYGLDPITQSDNIMGMMNRTFNIFVAPMGGLMLVGIFLPHVGGRAAVLASLCGLATSLLMALSRFLIPPAIGPSGQIVVREISFTWIIPGSLLVVFVVAAIGGWLDRALPAQIKGLTWRSRYEVPKVDPSLLAPSFREGVHA
jgi:SSS family transporter